MSNLTNLTVNAIGASQTYRGMSMSLVDPSTNITIATSSVLPDGTTRFLNVPTGSFRLQATHTNLIGTVATQLVHVLPGTETKASLLIDPSKFTNTSLVDVADQNLGPMIADAQAIGQQATGMAVRQPGELFTAEHYNRLALAVANLANNVALLAQAVTPHGHNHMEYENKLNELATNFDGLLQTLAKSTAQIQRRFDIQRMRERVEDVLDVSTATNLGDLRKGVFKLLRDLEASATASPDMFSNQMRSTASAIRGQLSAMVAALPAAFADVVNAYHAVLNEWDNRRWTRYDAENLDWVRPRETTFPISDFDPRIAVNLNTIDSRNSA